LSTAFLDRETVAPDFARDVRLTEDERVVDFLNVALLEESADFVREFFVGRGEDQTGSGGIEAVQQPESTGRTLGAVGPEIKFTFAVVMRRQQGAFFVARAVGLREFAGGLVEGGKSVGVVRDKADIAAERKC